MHLDDASSYFLNRATELRRMCAHVDPWVFLASSAFLEYLAKLANGKDVGREGYKDFILQYLAQVRPLYRDFTDMNGLRDLPVQMYHILRCGIVHSFSLIPDKMASSAGGRERSIILCHAKERDDNGWTHLMQYKSPRVNDAALFVAEDFTVDIEKATHLLLCKARTDTALCGNIEAWLKNHPPIAGGF